MFSKEFSKTLKMTTLLKKNKKIKNPQAVEAQGFSMELLPRFELGTSSLPTDWEDEVFCFPALLCPFQSGVPSFPALLCPLSPLLRFPVWVTVWVSSSSWPHQRRQSTSPPPQGFDDAHDVSQNTLRDLGGVVAEQALSCLGDPDLCPVCRGSSLCHMDVYRLQRHIFVGPKIHPIWSDLKDLRHVQSPPAGKTRGSDGQSTPAPPESGQFLSGKSH